MIKDPKRYRAWSERERAMRLRRLSYIQSAKRVEALLRLQLIHELHFAEDDHPVALDRTVYGKRR